MATDKTHPPGHPGGASSSPGLTDASADILGRLLDSGAAHVLVEGLPGLFYLYGSDSRLVAWNENLWRLTGHAPEDMPGKPALDWFQPEHQELIASKIQRVLETDEVVTVEAPLLNKDGSTTPYLLHGRRFFFDGHTYFMGLGIDIAERKALEQKVFETHKMEAVGSLAGGIAHDFNNLLVPILGFTELSIAAVADRPNVAADLQNVVRAAEHAKGLVANILAFSRHEPTGVEELDLGELVGEICGLLKTSHRANVQLNLIPSSDPVPIRADPSEIRQVILNLCTNGIHAMRNTGGHLRVEVGTAQRAHWSGGAIARLRVSDQGTGIPEADRHRVFDPFFTTKPLGEGTGLGLSVVHGIVTRLGGEVELDSTEGTGTRVEVRLPLHTTDSHPSGTEPPPQELPLPTGRGETLLVVDDDPLVAKALQRQLEGLDYTVEPFIDSRAARQAFAGDPGHYDAVITDYGMPHVNGLELAQIIRERAPGKGVVLLSGYGEGVEPSDVSEAGISYFDKPVALGQLARELRRLLVDP